MVIKLSKGADDSFLVCFGDYVQWSLHGFPLYRLQFQKLTPKIEMIIGRLFK